MLAYFFRIFSRQSLQSISCQFSFYLLKNGKSKRKRVQNTFTLKIPFFGWLFKVLLKYKSESCYMLSLVNVISPSHIRFTNTNKIKIAVSLIYIENFVLLVSRHLIKLSGLIQNYICLYLFATFSGPSILMWSLSPDTIQYVHLNKWVKYCSKLNRHTK